MIAALTVALWTAAPVLPREPASQAPRAAEGFARLLPRVRASREGLAERPAPWSAPLETRAIEAVLADPLLLPERSADWSRGLASADGLAGLVAFSGELLGVATEPPPATEAGAVVVALPSAVAEAIEEIRRAVLQAGPWLDRAAAGLSDEEREDLSRRLATRLVHVPPERLDTRLFESASRFDQAALLSASLALAVGVERAVRALERAATVEGGLPRSLALPGMTVTLGGAGDDEYSTEELSRSTLVLDLGGANRYLAAPAAAGPGQIRLVVDLGREVVIESSGPVASGRFGIGLLHLGNGAGPKLLRGGPFSLGAGLFGAGLLLARGPGSRFESGDFSQGAAAFGLGVIDVQGARPRLSAPLNAQGFGFTRGAGLLRVRGEEARLECGLAYPDPREEEAALSFCQGAGYGPRALAGGGFGLALVESDRASLDSGYFAQGLGYWRGFGGLYFKGDGARIQSRRYGQGAGIHSALGSLELVGSGNRLLHWGAGPAFGWDRGVGFASVRGAGNELRADWASGKGDVGGHGFLSVEGSSNRVRLGELATGTMTRSVPAYGLAIVSGTANSIWSQARSSAAVAGAVTLQPSLWGALEIHGSAVLDPDPASTPLPRRPPTSDRAEASRLDRARNARLLAEADRLPAPERLARWLFLAAEGGLDDRTPGEAFSRLLSLPDSEAAMLPGLAATEHPDELAQLHALLPAYGRRVVPALERAAAAAGGRRRAMLLALFRLLPAREGFMAALAAADEPDRRVRREALELLGSLFDRSVGEEPGRVDFLKAALSLCRRRVPRAPVAPAVVDRIGRKRLADLLAVLALMDASPEERLRVAHSAPDPAGPVPPGTLHAFAGEIGRRPEACRGALRRELGDVERLGGRAARLLAEALAGSDDELSAVGAAALGGLGRAADARRIAARLGGGPTREAAATGLAKLGSTARDAVARAMGSPDPGTRASACAAAAQSGDPGVLRLLARGLEDPDESVRLTAVAALSAVQAPLRGLLQELAPAVDGLAAGDPSPSVRHCAARAAATRR